MTSLKIQKIDAINRRHMQQSLQSSFHPSLQVPPAHQMPSLFQGQTSLQVQPRKIQLNEYMNREIASIFTKQLQENLTRPKSLFE